MYVDVFPNWSMFYCDTLSGHTKQKNILVFRVMVNDLQLILWTVKEEAVRIQPRLVRDRNAVVNWIIVYVSVESLTSALYSGSRLLITLYLLTNAPIDPPQNSGNLRDANTHTQAHSFCLNSFFRVNRINTRITKAVNITALEKEPGCVNWNSS